MKILFIIVITAFCAFDSDACGNRGGQCLAITQPCCDPYYCNGKFLRWGVCIGGEATTKSPYADANSLADFYKIMKQRGVAARK